MELPLVADYYMEMLTKFENTKSQTRWH